MFHRSVLTPLLSFTGLFVLATGSANAGFNLTLSQGGVSHTFNLETLASSGSGSVGGVNYSWSGYAYDGSDPNERLFELGDFTFGEYKLASIGGAITGDTNSPGGIVASLGLDALEVERLSGEGSAPTFTILLEASEFTSPTGNVDLHSQFTGQFEIGNSTGTAELQSYVTNESGSTLSDELGISISGANVGSDEQTSDVFNASAGYSIIHKITLENMSVGRNNRLDQGTINSEVKNAGSNINPVPGPAGLVLALTALPFVGLLRRCLGQAERAVSA